MIPIVLYTTNRATAAAIRSANGMIPGLRGNDLLLESRTQPLPLSQGQPQIGDLSQISRPGDRRDVDGLFLTVSAGFHQPHHPSHALTPDPRSDAKLPLRRPHPQSPGSPFLGLLIVMTIIEEIVVGLFHHQSIAASLGELFGHRLEETLAGYLIMLLVLIPFFAFRVLSEALGEGRLERMFFIDRASPTEQK